MEMNPNSAKACWYPLRAIYSQEIKIHKRFEELKIENLVPIRQSFEKDKNKEDIIKHIPLIHNLIFVKATEKELLYYKKYDKIVSLSRFITNRNVSEHDSRYLIIPDKQMQDFIRVVNSHIQNVEVLYNSAYIRKKGTRIRIKSGKLKGVEGVIKRFKGNRNIVISIDGVASLSISNLNSYKVEIINDNNK